MNDEARQPIKRLVFVAATLSCALLLVLDVGLISRSMAYSGSDINFARALLVAAPIPFAHAINIARVLKFNADRRRAAWAIVLSGGLAALLTHIVRPDALMLLTTISYGIFVLLAGFGLLSALRRGL